MTKFINDLPVRVLGLGASAGGLAALEDFFRHMSPTAGFAFMVVQHLDPTKVALLPELLRRVTSMPVLEANHPIQIEANTVYVIAPNTELTARNGQLRVSNPPEPRGLRFPIDALFSSLAIAYGDRSVAVLFSGMGSDGTLGMRSVKAVGGLTAVQNPTSAQFSAMPLSAVQDGVVDLIADSKELPNRILACIAPPSAMPEGHSEMQALDPSQWLPVIKLIQARTRHDFSMYKPSTLCRRIERRMAIHNLGSMDEYTSFLKQNPLEIDLLFKELLIGVTHFFRDPAVWEFMATTALPELLKQLPKGHKVRAWSAGCSTGEEAYSLAMVFAELQQGQFADQDLSLQIFASDLSADAIAFARRGLYSASISSVVSEQRLNHFFTARPGGYEVKRHIRSMVLFAQHDVVLDPPFTKLDLIVCRNVLIYFDNRLQRRLLPLFHYSLNPHGFMVLGSSETVGRLNHLFSPTQGKLRFYKRQNGTVARGADWMLQSMPPFAPSQKEQHVIPIDNTHSLNTNLQSAADHVLLQVYSPAAVVLNHDGDIVYISGRTGKYLEPAAGRATWNFHSMIRDGLRGPIYQAIKSAEAQQGSVDLLALEIEPSSKNGLLVDVTVQCMLEPPALRGMTLVVFRDRPPVSGRGRSKSKTGVDLPQSDELRRHQEEIFRLREDARASREELQAANEELQSTNEELQSTNEELTTSKEEMQSMNEELQTINAELQAKLDDLALAQSDMQNVLNSTEIAILFLDQNLHVRRYTDRASKIINLRENDLGRPLTDITSSLLYPEMSEDARQTLRTLVFSEKRVSASDGRSFSVRIMPYRRLDNVIDGVVITLVDISEKHSV